MIQDSKNNGYMIFTLMINEFGIAEKNLAKITFIASKRGWDRKKQIEMGEARQTIKQMALETDNQTDG